MPKRAINPDALFQSRKYGFSQIVTAAGGTTVYLSGQVAWDENQQIVGPGDLRAQTRQALRNMDTAMRAAGGSLADVVSLRIYIVHTQMEDTTPVRDGLLEFFPGDSPPASTWIAVHGLANKDFLIEIEAVAVID